MATNKARQTSANSPISCGFYHQNTVLRCGLRFDSSFAYPASASSLQSVSNRQVAIAPGYGYRGPSRLCFSSSDELSGGHGSDGSVDPRLRFIELPALPRTVGAAFPVW